MIIDYTPMDYVVKEVDNAGQKQRLDHLKEYEEGKG